MDPAACDGLVLLTEHDMQSSYRLCTKGVMLYLTVGCEQTDLCSSFYAVYDTVGCVLQGLCYT